MQFKKEIIKSIVGKVKKSIKPKRPTKRKVKKRKVCRRKGKKRRTTKKSTALKSLIKNVLRGKKQKWVHL